MARGKDAILRLHGRLVKRRDALRQALSGDLDSLRDYNATFDVGDSADAAIDTANDEINSQLAELEGRELEQIEHALDRIESGVYGRCELCGQKITEARINALPYTSTCIDCQRDCERSGLSAATVASEQRWAIFHEEESESEVNLSDFEADLSESNR